MSIKLYMHPASTASRPVRMFVADKKIPVTEVVVDILSGEHYGEAYSKLNPSRQVPMLEDGDLLLTESSAILKYLASKFEAPEYPHDLKKRAKVDEAMDWFNTQFYRDFGYGLVYPQVFPHHKRPTDEQHSGTIAWGKDKAKTWLAVLDSHFIGKNDYVANNTLSIADYFGGAIVTAGAFIGCTFEGFSNIQRWLRNLEKLPNWKSVNEVLMGFAATLKDKPFERV